MDEKCTCQLLLEKNKEIEKLKQRMDRLENNFRNLSLDFRNHKCSEIIDDVLLVKDSLQKPVSEIVEEILEERDKWGE